VPYIAGIAVQITNYDIKVAKCARANIENKIANRNFLGVVNVSASKVKMLIKGTF